jgi:hypothetical protein
VNHDIPLLTTASQARHAPRAESIIDINSVSAISLIPAYHN